MTTPVQRVTASSRSEAAALAQGRNAQLSLQECWPYLESYARKYGADPKILAGIVMQESGFKNFGVHYDGTGHGLIGLDDNGLLPAFEKWSGLKIGRGANAKTIPPELQLEFLAKTIGEMSRQYGDGFDAARAWHRGPGGMNDSRGQHYEVLIRGHIGRLFPGGRTPEGGQVPSSQVPGGSEPSPSQTRPQKPSKPQGTSRAGAEYTIRKGDTLWEIASRLKSQGMPGGHWDIIRQIQKLNPKITNPNLIIAGDTIRLPGLSGGKVFGSDDLSAGHGAALRRGANKIGGQTPAPVREVGDRDAEGPGKVPYINQYRPVGAERGYSNGPSNCGPTSMAMIARAFGYGKGMSDAQLINHLGKIGGTTSAGTGINGIAAMARAMGKKAQTKGPGPQLEWMKEQLKAGKLVVANGDYHAMPPHQNESRTSGHYVCVAGLDAHGNFIVRDPADQHVRTITPQQMAHFIRSNPNGGWQISIG